MPIVPALFSLTSRTRLAFQEREPLTFDGPVGDLPVVDDARWSSAFTGNSWGALLMWVALLILLQAVAWPLARRMFRVFPDEGWAFSRLLTVLIAGYLTWLLASLHIIRFQAIWAGMAVAAVGVASLILARRFPVRPATRPPHGNPIVVTAEVIFWTVFGLFLFYRLINPDSYHPYWGGEKPMEFAHLNAILRSAHFPPVDPWYSGGFINYYYYGTYLVALLIKLTGIPVEYAFNLAQPTFPALLASASFSVASAIGKRMTGSTFGAWLAGILGAIFVQFSGNLVVAARLVTRAIGDAGAVDGWGYWVWSPSRALPTPDRGINITEFPYFGALYADLHPHVIAMPFTILVLALGWQMAATWRSFPLLVGGARRTAINVLSTVVPAIMAALALGSLFMINAWDLPMFAIVTGVAIIMLTAGIRAFWRRAGIVALMVGIVAVLAFLVTLPFNLHYVALFGEIDTVRDTTPLLGIESHVGAQLVLVTFGAGALMMPRSGWDRSIQISIGVATTLLLVFFLILQWLGVDSASPNQWIAEAGVVLTVGSVWLLSAWIAASTHGTLPKVVTGLVMVGAGVVGVTTLGLVITERQAMGLYGAIGLSAGLMWLSLPRPSERFVMMIVAGAALLGASLEIVYLVDDLSGGDWYRMNTIFKFYNQIWNLLGIATGVLAGRALWDIAVHGEDRLVSDEGPPPRIMAWITAGLTIPVMFATLAYAIVATPIRLDTQFPGGEGLTLDAYGWMEYAEIPLFRVEDVQRVPIEPLSYEDDLAAITWINENIHGTPVIAEAAFGTYRCNGSRFSIHTGLPAVIGWQRHQQQQRYLDDLAIRERALRELYTTPDQQRQLAIIDQYDIEYIIVGETERHYPTIEGNDCVDTGSPEAIASLESMAGYQLQQVFSSGSTTIYRVAGD